MTNMKLSAVIPVFNDEEVLYELYERLNGVFTKNYETWQIILIDDGSEDRSWEMIEELTLRDDRVYGIKLMRNFGQQNAIAAGLDYTRAEIVVIMDSDLQDRPEDIPMLVQALEESDASMAIAKWKTRQDSMFKLAVSRLFYNVSKKITKLGHEPGLGVFRAIRGELVQELKKYQEKTSSTISLLYWIGVDYVTVELDRDARFAGKSGYTIRKMLKLTLDRFFSFSMFPIRASIYSGLMVSLLSFLLALTFIIRRFLGLVAPGWTSIVVIILFLFGMNFIFLGVIGEYLGRIFLETKQRPKYIVKKMVGEKCKE